MLTLRLACLVTFGLAVLGLVHGQDTKTTESREQLPHGALVRFGTAKMRHGSRILALGYSPNDKILAAGGGDDPVRLWDTTTGEEIRQCKDLWAGHLVFSTYGSMLATAGPFKNIRLWQVDKGREVNQLKGHKGRITAMAFYKDGLLASGDSEGIVHLWELATSLEVAQLRRHEGEITSLAFALNGKRLVSGSADGVIWSWDPEGRKNYRAMQTGARVNAVAISPDRKTIFSGGDDGAIRMWDADTARPTGTINEHKDAITSLLVHSLQDDDLKIISAKLISASRDRTICIRELSRSDAKPVVITRHEGDADALAVSGDGKHIACAGTNNTIRRWEMATGKEVLAGSSHQAPVTGISLSSDGNTLVSASSKGTVRVWESKTGRGVSQWSLPMSGETQVCFSPDRTTVATAGQDGVHLFSTEGKEKKVLVTGPGSDPVLSLAYSTDGKSLAVGYTSGSVLVWDTAADFSSKQFKYDGPAHTLAFSPDGSTLAVSGSAKVMLIELTSGKAAAFMSRRGPTSTLPAVTCLAFSADVKILGIASYDGIIRLWNVETGKEVRALEGHQSAVYSIAFSPDGRHLVSASFDRTVRLWETFGGQTAAVWTGHTGPVTAVAFAPTGRVAYSGSADTTILAWDVTGTSGKSLPNKLTEAELENVWKDMSSTDASLANRAIWRLVAATSLPFLAKQVFVLDRKQLVQQLKDLNDTNYRVREKATKELASYGRWIEGVLREALKTPPSEEARRRLDGLLQKLIGSGSITIEQERLRARRAMLALEQLGGDEAIQTLERLANGAPEDDLCEEARASIARIQKRTR